MFLLLILGCGEGTLIGKWKQRAIVANGEEIPQKDWTLVINEDGTYEMSRNTRRGNFSSNKGTWKHDPEKRTLQMIRENGFVEIWTNVSIHGELRVTGRDFEVIFVRAI